MNFGSTRRGQRFQVDLADPRVAGLIRGGYLSIVKEPDRGPMDSADDSGGSDIVSGGGMDSGDLRDAQEEEVDGQGEVEPSADDPDGA